MQPEKEQNQSGWAFHIENEPAEGNQTGPAPSPLPAPAEAELISWTGSEFLDKHKSEGWYISLFGVIAGLCAVIYVISRDYLSVGFVAVMGVLFGVIASRKPRQLQYQIDGRGIQIGRRYYPFSEFKSFSVQREGVIGYINLLPLKRLHPEIAVYYPPEEEQRIFDTLSRHIPHEDHQETLIDKFTRLIRF